MLVMNFVLLTEFELDNITMKKSWNYLFAGQS